MQEFSWDGLLFIISYVVRSGTSFQLRVLVLCYMLFTGSISPIYPLIGLEHLRTMRQKLYRII